MHTKGPESDLLYSAPRYYAHTWRFPAESCREDLELCKNLRGSCQDGSRHEPLREIASAAESGQDFSLRRLIDPFESHKAQTTCLSSVDPNAFLLGLETDIALFRCTRRRKDWQFIAEG